MEAKLYKYILIFSHPAWHFQWVSLMVIQAVYYQVGNLSAVDQKPHSKFKILKVMTKVQNISLSNQFIHCFVQYLQQHIIGYTHSVESTYYSGCFIHLWKKNWYSILNLGKIDISVVIYLSFLLGFDNKQNLYTKSQVLLLSVKAIRSPFCNTTSLEIFL